MKTCPLCKQTVDKDDPDTWKEVKGWVGGVKQDSMRLRTDTGEYAHGTCVRAVGDGQVPGAGDLFSPGDEPTTSSVPSNDPVNDFFESEN